MSHYYSSKQTSKDIRKTFTSHLRNRPFSFVSSSGVFSKNAVDNGTYVLANTMTIKNGDAVLDMGCGIGILGIVAASMGAKVTMSDVNSRAVSLAKQNAKLNKIHAHILLGNLYEKISDKDFDVILSNPPQSAGKQVCFQLIEQAKDFLKENGTLQLVARPNKGGKTLAQKMENVFGNVCILGKGSGFAVYASRKTSLELNNPLCSERD